MFKVGRVIGYYEKTGIALVELEGTISIHDKIKFVDDVGDLFSQAVDSIQIGHDKVDFANRGSVVLLKTHEMVKKGTEIFKTS